MESACRIKSPRIIQELKFFLIPLIIIQSLIISSVYAQTGGDSDQDPCEACAPDLCLIDNFPFCPKSGEPCVLCERCGNGYLYPPEECDEGLDNGAEAACRECLLPRCGDGVSNEFDTGETCDDLDFKVENPKGMICRSDCSFCGDGVLNNSDEECDFGIPAGQVGYHVNCRDSTPNECTIAECGDGIVDTELNETCEPTLDVACRTEDCKKCGDNIIDVNFEECDGTSLPTDAPNGARCVSCILEWCGDGKKNGNEECDPSDPDPSNAGCNVECTGFSQCDDGYEIICDYSCEDAYGNPIWCCECPECGDDELNGPEECDGTYFISQPAGVSDAQWATRTCALVSFEIDYGPYCGDGIINNEELCDGTNFIAKPSGVPDAQWATRTCDPVTCEIEYGPYCGDGIINNQEQCDGSSFIDKPAEVSDEEWATRSCNPATCEIEYCTYFRLRGNNQTGSVSDQSVFMITEDGSTRRAATADDFSCLDSIWGNLGNQLQRQNASDRKDDDVFNYFLIWLAAELTENSVSQTTVERDVVEDGKTDGNLTSQSVATQVDTTDTQQTSITPTQQRLFDLIANQSSTDGSGRSYQTGELNRLLNQAKALLGNPVNNNLDNIRIGGQLTNVYFDKDCNVVTDVSSRLVCGEFNVGYIVSPISLLLDTTSVNENWNVVRFKMNPAKEEYVLWKASSKAPLLVYDPEKTGVVKDGSQLFGNYTFSDRLNKIRNVSLDLHNKIPDALWSNGYEALAVLDKDGDGRLEGLELNGLALWFDENQNGISEEGEVRELSTVGIFSVNTIPDYKDKNGDIHAIVGFERKIDNETTIGASVDWFTNSFSNMESAINYLFNNKDKESKNQALISQDKESFDQDESAIKKSEITGIWKWEIKDDLIDSKAFGLLAMIEDEKGNIFGNSVLEEYLQSNKRGLKSYLAKYPIKGKKLNNKNSIEFETISNSGVTLSSAKLSEDGKKLNGKSTIIIKNDEAPNSKTTISYHWEATKFVY